MRTKGYWVVCILLPLIIIAGCIESGDKTRDPREGDLSFIIKMDQTDYNLTRQNGTVFNVTPESIIVEIIIENNCSDALLIQKYLIFSATLSENITGPDGIRIALSYFALLDYDPTYSNFEPGEKMSIKIDLLEYGSTIKIEDDYISFNWDRAGQYTINFYYHTFKNGGGNLGVKSNIITLNFHN